MVGFWWRRSWRKGVTESGGGDDEGMVGLWSWFGKKGFDGGGFGRSRGRATFSAITESECVSLGFFIFWGVREGV